MFFIALRRSIFFACQSFWRNIWLSLVTIFIIFLAFLSVNFLIVIQAVSGSAVTAVKDKIDVSIYFKQGIREDKIVEIKSRLETLPQIKTIVYRSPEQNLEEFKNRHQADANIQETLKELEGNPLGATIIVRAKETKDYPEILKAIDNPAYADLIEEKSYDDNQGVISNINKISDNVKKGGLIASAVFVLIAILIIFNTVRIAIFTRRDEIGIMKLVGANNWFIRSPFIMESILNGVLACLISVVIIYSFLSLLQPQLAKFFEGANFNLIGYFNEHFILIFGGQILSIIILAIISSSLAITKYLKV